MIFGDREVSLRLAVKVHEYSCSIGAPVRMTVGLRGIYRLYEMVWRRLYISSITPSEAYGG